ncbi:hypothetical protein OF829_09085 [Sphingomonas sp. LB-2]|uniref:hypothetical protein n=1 Tax=Sphingomonas caeni TaxID=2984949 RepID=UPI002230936D|nr:hypothetical protein [Sphingomonas caeni]MCW3847395.1 hypothetical protein [Sphingomonas caeni]
MAEEGRDYNLCGWRVSSEINLPELAPWPGTPGPIDVAIRIGEVPPSIPNLVLDTPFLQTDAEGHARYTIPGVADFLVEHGRSITIQPGMDPESPDVRLWLLGSVFGLLCNQRGLLPLHAASVEIDGKAVAFAGASGSGKSTLAAAFNRRGFRLFADDVTPIAVDGGQVRFLPGLRRIRLWPDSLRDADWDVAELERCREGIEKFSRSFDRDFVTEPMTPAALFHLRPISDTIGDVMLTRLQGAGAVQQVRRQVYRWRTLKQSVGRPEAISRVIRAAAGIPRHFELFRRVGFDNLDATVDAVVETVRLIR